MWFIWILALIILIVFYAWTATIFFSFFIEVAVNAALLWITITRSYVEIKKENKGKYYLIALLITSLLFFIAYNQFTSLSLRIHIWWPVLFIAIIFILSQIIIYMDNLKQRKTSRK